MEKYYRNITRNTVVFLDFIQEKPTKLKERFSRVRPYVEDNYLIKELNLDSKEAFEKDVQKLSEADIIEADTVADYLDCFKSEEIDAIADYLSGSGLAEEAARKGELDKLLIAIRYNTSWVPSEEVDEDGDGTVIIEDNEVGKSFVWF